MKATHLGACQVCGRMHKLPGGVLAKHGYEVTDGWFNGVCMGAGHLPYEQSCDIIQRSIDWLKLNAQRQDERAVELAQHLPEYLADSKTWAHVYHPELSSRTKGSVRVWEEVEVVDHGTFSHKYITKSGQSNAFYSPGSKDDKITAGVLGYIKHLRGLAAMSRHQAETQQLRIKDWRPRELTSISQL